MVFVRVHCTVLCWKEVSVDGGVLCLRSSLYRFGGQTMLVVFSEVLLLLDDRTTMYAPELECQGSKQFC